MEKNLIIIFYKQKRPAMQAGRSIETCPYRYPKSSLRSAASRYPA